MLVADSSTPVTPDVYTVPRYKVVNLAPITANEWIVDHLTHCATYIHTYNLGGGGLSSQQADQHRCVATIFSCGETFPTTAAVGIAFLKYDM